MNEQLKPNPDLKPLERLIGTWKQSGELDGKITYEWAPGGFFLLQHVDFMHGENKIKGVEIIGHESVFGTEPSSEIKSRFYSFFDGMTLDYVYEIEGDTLTIWGGEKGSPAYYKGTFSEDGNTLTGSWVYPGGGGYDAVSTKVK
ncbi:MAG TPA: hypothetical protein VJ830_08345 [Anaerolineales bacterium]|nr:hypothetical protein [Anaerolineales bacterium]